MSTCIPPIQKMSNQARQKSIIQNPNGIDFANTYVCMGKVDGKKRLREDCQRLRIQIPLAGLQAIEKGFSRKSRISYQNGVYGGSSDTLCVQAWGDVNLKDNNLKKRAEHEAKKAKEEEEKQKQDALDAIEKKKQEKIARIQRKKEKKWLQEKAKMAVVDSWEDL